MRHLNVCRYVGAKATVIDELAAVLPAGRFEQWHDYTVGAGSFSLYAVKNNLADSYWVNDKFKPVAGFWECLTDESKSQRLAQFLRSVIAQRVTEQDAKRIYKYFRQKAPESIEGIAARFFIVNRMSYSGSTESGGRSPDASFNRFTLSSIQRLEAAAQLLQSARVRVTCGDYYPLLFQGTRDFSFIDPPYSNTKGNYYGNNGDCHKFDYARLSSELKDVVRGKFLITLDNSPTIRQLFSWANIREWGFKYGATNVGSDKCKVGKELFISNYDYPSI